MFTDPQRRVRRDTTGRALLDRPSRVNRSVVRPLAFALVFEQRENVRHAADLVLWLFGGDSIPLPVQGFDRYEVVLPSVVVRERVQEVAALPLEAVVTLRDSTPLPLVVVRPVLFA